LAIKHQQSYNSGTVLTTN
ncbi:unnamed protein product, partial [Rhizophagus irregularis]